MDIAIDVVFEPKDAFRATVAAPPPVPPSMPAAMPPSMPTAMVAMNAPIAASRRETVVIAPRSRPARWPVFVCAFVAVTAATVAFLKSPAATHPRVAPYVTSALDLVD